MESSVALSQDSIILSSRVEGEEFDRFQLLANGSAVYGDGTKEPSKKNPVWVDIPPLDDDVFGNPTLYNEDGKKIPRDEKGYIIVEEVEDEEIVAEEVEEPLVLDLI